MTELPALKSVVVCTEHQGAHVGVVAAHIGNRIGVAWGLNQIPANRVHARDGVTCAPDLVRVCDEADLPGGDFQRADLRVIRWAAGARGPAEQHPAAPNEATRQARERAARKRKAAAPTRAYCMKCHKDDLPPSLLCDREPVADNGPDDERDPELLARYEGLCLRCCTHNHA